NVHRRWPGGFPDWEVQRLYAEPRPASGLSRDDSQLLRARHDPAHPETDADNRSALGADAVAFRLVPSREHFRHERLRAEPAQCRVPECSRRDVVLWRPGRASGVYQQPPDEFRAAHWNRLGSIRSRQAKHTCRLWNLLRFCDGVVFATADVKSSGCQSDRQFQRVRDVIESVAELLERDGMRIGKCKSESFSAPRSHLPWRFILGFIAARHEAHVHAAVESKLGASVLRRLRIFTFLFGQSKRARS